MLFLKLTVDNFGVFQGHHIFDLAPQLEAGQRRNLTIISGHNGAGKTTLFQAMALALHGSAYLENTRFAQRYHSLLLSRMHRFPDATNHISESRVTLSFEYVKSGKSCIVEVERRWRKQGLGVREVLNVEMNGRTPEIDSADYQTWIDDFIPPGVGQLCFFDAEQLDALASQDQQSFILHETLTRLLGLDWIQHLDTDLRQLINHQGSLKKIEHLYIRALELQVDRDKIDGQINQLQQQLEEVNADLSSCEAALTKQNRLLAAEGGAYAARKPVLENRLQAVRKEVELLSNQLRDLCSDLLPFALTPELCLQLYKRLNAEIEIHRQQTLNSLLREKLPQIEEMLSENAVWEDLHISPTNRKYIVQQLTAKLQSLGGVQYNGDAAIIHQLSDPEHLQLRSWISQVLRDIPQQVRALAGRLKVLKEEQRHIEHDLQRAPDDEVLTPIHIEISRLKGILSSKQKRQTALNEQIGSLQFQRTEKQKSEKQLKYAKGSQLIMRTYKDVLTRHKLSVLEEALITSFNKICRKEHLLAKARIDPESFEIGMESIDGAPLKLSDFSAGERQLYAMALLWALRRVSNLSLPLAVDTPLARLDEIHRLRLIHDYIPRVSDQVLLFSTDAELDAHLLQEAQFETARIYRLNYNSELGETKVTLDENTYSRNRMASFVAERRIGTYGV